MGYESWVMHSNFLYILLEVLRMCVVVPARYEGSLEHHIEDKTGRWLRHCYWRSTDKVEMIKLQRCYSKMVGLVWYSNTAMVSLLWETSFALGFTNSMAICRVYTIETWNMQRTFCMMKWNYHWRWETFNRHYAYVCPAFWTQCPNASSRRSWHGRCPVAHTERRDHANETRKRVEQNAHTIQNHCLSN